MCLNQLSKTQHYLFIWDPTRSILFSFEESLSHLILLFWLQVVMHPLWLCYFSSKKLIKIMLTYLQISRLPFHLLQFYLCFFYSGQNFFTASYGWKQILQVEQFPCLLLLVSLQFFFIFLGLVFVLLLHQLFSFYHRHLCVSFLIMPLDRKSILLNLAISFNHYSFYFLLIYI